MANKFDIILGPMFNILNNKNVIQGVSISEANEKLCICFNKKYLSDTNKLILEKISMIYSETFFHTDDQHNLCDNKVSYWCPDEYLDKEYHITEQIRERDFVFIELDLSNDFVILGTSIMLANMLQEQDPLEFDYIREKTYIEKDIMDRHTHYIDSGCPDKKWISLKVYLDRNNPLRENVYAPMILSCEINSPVICDNMILSTLVGYNEKTYLTFCMDEEYLREEIENYLQKLNTLDTEKNLTLNETTKMLLLSN